MVRLVQTASEKREIESSKKDSVIARSDSLIPGAPGNFERVFYLCVYSILVACRIPQILTAGRFWAEEGNVFFTTACVHPWYQSLLLPYGGYLNLPANLGADLACHLAPLEWAPYATIGLAFLFQVLPVVLLFTSKDSWLNNRVVLVASLLALATAPMAQELWLTTLQSQVFLTLSCSLILAMNCSSGSIEWLRRATLLLAPLSGCTSILLAPFFLVRAFVERSRQRFIQACFIAAGSLLQILLFVIPSAGAVASRYSGISPTLLLTVFFEKQIVIPLLGADAAEYIEILRHSYELRSIDIAPLIGSVAFICALSAIAWTYRKTAAVWLIVPGLLLPIASFTCALDPKTDMLLLCDGNRYAFAGRMLIAVCCFAMLKLGSSRTKLLCALLSAWLLFVGVSQYRRTHSYFNSGPSWRMQINAWRKEPATGVGGWPKGWMFQLDPTKVH